MAARAHVRTRLPVRKRASARARLGARELRRSYACMRACSLAWLFACSLARACECACTRTRAPPWVRPSAYAYHAYARACRACCGGYSPAI
eukprot:5305778-Pleurochrysis_carterae.AAC.2